MDKWLTRIIILFIILALSFWTIHSHYDNKKFIFTLEWRPVTFDSSCEPLPKSLLKEVIYHVYVKTLNGFKVELVGMTKSTYFEIDLSKYQFCDIGVSATLLYKSSSISWFSDERSRSMESPCPDKKDRPRRMMV